MDVVGDALDAVGELGRIRHEVAVGVALLLQPAVVDVDVLVARGLHAVRDHRIGRLLDQLRAHAAAEGVPVVPPQLRGGGQPVGQRARGRRCRQHGDAETEDEDRRTQRGEGEAGSPERAATGRTPTRHVTTSAGRRAGARRRAFLSDSVDPRPELHGTFQTGPLFRPISDETQELRRKWWNLVDSRPTAIEPNSRPTEAS